MAGRNYSLGSSARNNTDELSQFNKNKNIYLCTVLDDNDPSAAGLIKVRIKGLDDKKLDSELPFCWPFLPLYLNIVPKKGDTVKVILYDQRNNDSYREYIGPVIPQLGEFLRGTISSENARAGREGQGVPFYKSINVIPTTSAVPDTGVPSLYPLRNEIAIQGRENADLVFKNSEVLIRAAKFLPNEPTIRNEKNPAYIQIKTLNPGKYEKSEVVNSTEDPQQKGILAQEEYDETRTDIKMVSNKIYLVGRDSSSSVVEPFMSDEQQTKIENKLHPIVYGDILKDFIERLFKWAQTHTHAYHNVPQNPATDSFLQLQRWVLFELPKLNSKNIFAGGDIPTNNNNNTLLDETVTSLRGGGSNDNEILTRVNQFIERADDNEQPLIEIKGSKLEIDGEARVDLQIVNISDGRVLASFDTSGNNLVSCYTSTLSKVTQFLIQERINPLKIKPPQLDDLENF